MSYTPENNPFIPGDPYSYDLKWIVQKIKAANEVIANLDETIQAKVIAALEEVNPVVYSNVAKMIDANQNAGTLAYTLGYHQEADGGNALYYITDDYNDIFSADFYVTVSTNKWAIPIVITPYVTPEMFGAFGDETHDDTEAFAVCVNYKNIVLSKKYAIKNWILSDNVVYGNSATIIKNIVNDSTATFIDAGTSCLKDVVVYGKNDVDPEGNVFTNGINVSGGILENVIVHDFSRNGIRVESNSSIIGCHSYNNGSSNSLASDGIYISNADNVIVKNCIANSNMRNGISDTTNPLDPDLSGKVVITNCECYDNGLVDIDAEQTKNTIISNVKAGTIYTSGSKDCSIENCLLTLGIYGTNAKRISIRNVTIIPTSNRQFVYLNGSQFTIDNVKILDDNQLTYSGAAFQIIDADNLSVISNCFIEKCFNGFNLSGILSANGLFVKTADNRAYQLNSSRLSLLAKYFEIKANTFVVYSNSTNVITGTPNEFDTIVNTIPVESGSPAYVINKWIYYNGAWVELRCETGN